MKLLINPNTGYSYASKYQCYNIVSDCRRQSPDYQADWWRDDAKFKKEKAILAHEKQIEAEERKAERRAKMAAKQNKKKRDKRKAAKEQASAAIAEDDTEDSEELEEVSCVFVLFVILQFTQGCFFFLLNRHCKHGASSAYA